MPWLPVNWYQHNCFLFMKKTDLVGVIFATHLILLPLFPFGKKTAPKINSTLTKFETSRGKHRMEKTKKTTSFTLRCRWRSASPRQWKYRHENWCDSIDWNPTSFYMLIKKKHSSVDQWTSSNILLGKVVSVCSFLLCFSQPPCQLFFWFSQNNRRWKGLWSKQREKN